MGEARPARSGRGEAGGSDANPGRGDGGGSSESAGAREAKRGRGEAGGRMGGFSGGREGRRRPRGEGPSATFKGANSIAAAGGKCAEGPPVDPGAGGGGRVGRSPPNREPDAGDGEREDEAAFRPSWESGSWRWEWREGSVFPDPMALGMAL